MIPLILTSLRKTEDGEITPNSKLSIKIPDAMTIDEFKSRLRDIDFLNKIKRTERIISNVNLNMKRIGFTDDDFEKVKCNLDEDFDLFSCTLHGDVKNSRTVKLIDRVTAQKKNPHYHEIEYNQSIGFDGIIGDRGDSITGDKYVNELDITIPIREDLSNVLPIDAERIARYETGVRKWKTKITREKEGIIDTVKTRTEDEIKQLHDKVTKIVQSYLPSHSVRGIDVKESYKVKRSRWGGETLHPTFRLLSAFFRDGKFDISTEGIEGIKGIGDVSSFEDITNSLHETVDNNIALAKKRLDTISRGRDDDERVRDGKYPSDITSDFKIKDNDVARLIQVKMSARSPFGGNSSSDTFGDIYDEIEERGLLLKKFIDHVPHHVKKVLPSSKIIKDITRSINCELKVSWSHELKASCDIGNHYGTKINGYKIPYISSSSLELKKDVEDPDIESTTIKNRSRYGKGDEVKYQFRDKVIIYGCFAPTWYDTESLSPNLWNWGSRNYDRGFNVVLHAINEIATTGNDPTGVIITSDLVKNTNTWKNNDHVHDIDDITPFLRTMGDVEEEEYKKFNEENGIAWNDDKSELSLSIKALESITNIVNKATIDDHGKIKVGIYDEGGKGKLIYRGKNKDITITNEDLPERLNGTINSKKNIVSTLTDLLSIFPNINPDDNLIIRNRCSYTNDSPDMFFPRSTRKEFIIKQDLVSKNKDIDPRGIVRFHNAGYVPIKDIPVMLKDDDEPKDFVIYKKSDWNEIKKFLSNRLFPRSTEKCTVYKLYTDRAYQDDDLANQFNPDKEKSCSDIRDQQDQVIDLIERKFEDVEGIIVNVSDLVAFTFIEKMFDRTDLVSNHEFMKLYGKKEDDDNVLVSYVADDMKKIIEETTGTEHVTRKTLTDVTRIIPPRAYDSEKAREVLKRVMRDIDDYDNALDITCDFQPSNTFDTVKDYENGFGCVITVPHEKYGTVRHVYGREIDELGNIYSSVNPTKQSTVCLPRGERIIKDDILGEMKNTCYYPADIEKLDLFTQLSPDVKFFDNGFIRKGDFYSDKKYDAITRLGGLNNLIHNYEFPFYIGVKNGKIVVSEDGTRGKAESTSIPPCNTFPLKGKPLTKNNACIDGDVEVIADAHVHPSGSDFGFTPSFPDLVHPRTICAFNDQALSCHDSKGGSYNIWMEKTGGGSGMPDGTSHETVIGDFGQCIVNHDNPTESLLCVVGKIDDVKDVSDVSVGDPIEESYYAMMSASDQERKNVLKHLRFKDKVVTLKNHSAFLIPSLNFTQNVLVESETRDGRTVMSFGGHPYLGCTIKTYRTLLGSPVMSCNALGNVEEML